MDEPLAALLDVAVQDCGVGVDPEFVGDAVHVEPDIRPDLAAIRLVMDAVVEDLGPAARERAQAGALQFREHPPDAVEPRLASRVAEVVGALVHLGDLGEVHDLHGRECLDVQIAPQTPRFRADRRDQVGVVTEREVGVQAADGVDLGGARFHGLADLVLHILHVTRVRADVVLLAVELAELAREGADVGIVEVAVDVEVRGLAVQAAAHRVCQTQHGPEIRRGVERLAVVECEPIAGENLGPDAIQPAISVRWGTGLRERGHGPV